MPFVVYMDEAGDHSLEAVDAGFPVFALAIFICDAGVYTNQIVPAMYSLKFDFFGQRELSYIPVTLEKGRRISRS